MRVIDDIWNKLMLKRKEVSYESDIKIYGRLYIHGKKKGIVIGKKVTINSSESVNPTSGVNHTHIRAESNGKIVIGNHVGISHANITAFESVKIEDNVLIGSGTKIWDTDFHPLDYDSRQKGDKAVSKPVLIKEGAFVGANSIILKGVTIGKHSIVGAGSVVTKSIPDNEIWGGNPAVYLKKIT